MNNREEFSAMNGVAADRRRERNEGIDCSVVYITIKQLARMAGVCKATVDHDIQKGKLVVARRGGGRSMTLIHPDVAKAYILSKGRKNAEAA